MVFCSVLHNDFLILKAAEILSVEFIVIGNSDTPSKVINGLYFSKGLVWMYMCNLTTAGKAL